MARRLGLAEMMYLDTMIELGSGLQAYDLDIRVHYTVYQGRDQTLTDPAEPAHCVIGSISAKAGDKWLEIDWPDDLYEDEELLALCMLDYEEMCERNEGDRADSIREERMLDRGQ